MKPLYSQYLKKSFIAYTLKLVITKQDWLRAVFLYTYPERIVATL